MVTSSRTLGQVLDEHGWAVLPGEAAELVVELEEVARGVGLVAPDGTAFSDHALDGDARREVHREVGRLVGPLVGRLAPDHRVVSASFVVKGPQTGEALEWHLDPSITDERRWRSISLWIPLVEVGPGRGALELLDVGHLGAPADRGGRRRLVETHPPHAASLAACEQRAGRPTGPLVLRAGDVVAYDHRMPHRSDPNVGDRARPAVNVGLLPLDAPLLVYLWPEGEPVAHEVPEDFFATADLAAEPSGWFPPAAPARP